MEYDKVYKLCLNISICWSVEGDKKLKQLDHINTNNIFEDGRNISKPLEYIMAEQHGFKFSKNGNSRYDLMHQNGRKIEQRCVKNKVTIKPSSQHGAGRLFNKKELEDKASSMDYLFIDINHYPNVTYILKDGNEMLKLLPTGETSNKSVIKEIMTEKCIQKRKHTKNEEFYTKPTIVDRCLS